MTTFEWVVTGLVLTGLVIPVWVVVGFALIGGNRPSRRAPSVRYFAYMRILDTLGIGKGDFKISNGAIWAATIRELRDYPEYADLSVLLLEEITITGTNKFDQIMKHELEATETYLLGQKNG